MYSISRRSAAPFLTVGVSVSPQERAICALVRPANMDGWPMVSTQQFSLHLAQVIICITSSMVFPLKRAPPHIKTF